ncbi:MAG: hypothetical protein V4663_16770 [Bacteroidota bacterium]
MKPTGTRADLTLKTARQKMNINYENSWPDDVLEFLADNFDLFLQYELHLKNERNNYHYADHSRSKNQLREILNNHKIIGFHCTRLLQAEIDCIRLYGLTLQNNQNMFKRIRMLKIMGEFNSAEIESLAGISYYNKFRSPKLHFCFSQLKNEGEQGIGNFFKYWGGEALRDKLAMDMTIIEKLKNVGIPCIIEASLPINNLYFLRSLEETVAKTYIINCHFETNEIIDLEGWQTEEVAAEEIVNIHEFPEPSFLKLTECNTWDEKL